MPVIATLAELSGGMQQRVSIARALAVDPDIIFMDEPLGALDALTRINLQDEISRICREEGKTVVFVTHDIEEAVVLADRVVVLSANPGRVQTIIPVNIIDRTDRTSASFVNIRNHIFEQFQLAKRRQNRVLYLVIYTLKKHPKVYTLGCFIMDKILK